MERGIAFHPMQDMNDRRSAANASHARIWLNDTTHVVVTVLAEFLYRVSSRNSLLIRPAMPCSVFRSSRKCRRVVIDLECLESDDEGRRGLDEALAPQLKGHPKYAGLKEKFLGDLALLYGLSDPLRCEVVVRFESEEEPVELLCGLCAGCGCGVEGKRIEGQSLKKWHSCLGDCRRREWEGGVEGVDWEDDF